MHWCPKTKEKIYSTNQSIHGPTGDKINIFFSRVNTNEGVGVLLADNHGLCLSTAGDVDPKSSGIISAIAQHVSKLEPSSSTPVICISGDQGWVCS